MRKWVRLRALVGKKWLFHRFEDLKVGQLFETLDPQRSGISVVTTKPYRCNLNQEPENWGLASKPWRRK